MSALLIIAGRVLASPLVNVFQKKLTNRQISPEFIVMMSYLFFVVLSIPVLIIEQPFSFSSEFWIYILLLGVIDIFGNMFLVRSLKSIDLSVFGPLNSFKPVFALFISIVVLNEIPSTVGVAGVVVIVMGSYLLAYNPATKKIKLRDIRLGRGVLFRFLAIALTSIAAVFSKKAIIMSSPLITLAYWSLIGFPVSLALFLRSGVPIKTEIQQALRLKQNFMFLFLSFFALQLLTLLTFERIFVGYSLALFQLSGLISILFGYHFFKERNLKYRLAGAIVMCLGAMLIALFG